MSVLLGAIADDFTGATDLCNTLVRRGMRTVQLIGVPAAAPRLPDAEAVVVALKSRTIPAAEAIEKSLAALAWLRERRGAAGPVQILLDLRLDRCRQYRPGRRGADGRARRRLHAVLPGFPETGRTIYRGYLFVGDVLLSESGMRDHPLTPMRDPSLVRVLQRQSRGRVGLVPVATRRPRRRGDPRRLRRTAASRVIATRSSMRSRTAHLEAIGEAAAGLRADHRRLRHRARPAGEFPPPGPSRQRRRAPTRLPADLRRRGGAVGIVLAGDPGASRLHARAGAGVHGRPDRHRRRPRCGRRQRSIGPSRCSATGRS